MPLQMFQTPGILSLAEFWHLLEQNGTYKLILMVTYGRIYLQTDYLWLLLSIQIICLNVSLKLIIK